MRTWRTRQTGIAWLLPLLLAAAWGQKPAQIRVGSGPYAFTPVLVAQTNTVPATVVVRDGKGRVIRGLARDRFHITDDGAPQAYQIAELHNAAAEQAWWSTPEGNRGRGSWSCRRPDSSARRWGDEKEPIIRDALRDGVVINALDAAGLYAEGPELSLPEESDTGETLLPLATFVFEELEKFPMREAQVDVMANFAAATGGQFFRNNNDLTLGFERLGLAPGARYALAFTPASLPHDGKLHQIRVTIDPPIQGATIEARRGYFTPAPGLNQQGVERALDQAKASGATASGVPAEVATEATAGGLRVQVHFSVTAEREKLALVAGLFGGNGRYVSGERGEVDLALKSGTYKKLRERGWRRRGGTGCGWWC